MGLLSDPEYGSVKWVKVLKKVHAPVCIVCYVGAIVWFLMLAHRDFNNETYFSENALLPGLVTNEFNGERAAKQFFNEFLQELEYKYDDNDEIPVPWLVAKLSQLHLDVYTHNFTLDYPMGNGQKYVGTNVYGILRAARTPSLEAVVVTAPYRSLASHQKGTHAGIALMLAFAQFARPQKYWAKDIIFLITEHEQLGIQAWLEAYHGLQSDAETFYTSLGSFWSPGTPALDLSRLVPVPGLAWTGAGAGASDRRRCLNPGKLKGRSGSIQAAINLEFHSPNIKYIEVKVEGLNGQLPNLDLVNLVHKLCVKSGIHHSYKNSYSWLRTRNKMEEWRNGVWTVMGMVVAQIAGVPTGNHGLFHRFNIEAVTLEGRDADDHAPPPRLHTLSNANFHRLGVLLESVFRSLNNLLERFHQSYFFYLLPATNRFVSIGQYMPSLCLLCVAMLVRALYLWVTIQEHDQTDKPNNLDKDKTGNTDELKTTEGTEKEKLQAEVPGDKKREEAKHEELDSDEFNGTEKEKLVDAKVPGDKKRERVNRQESSMSIVNIGTNYLFVHLLGYAVMNSPMILSNIGAKYWQLQSEVSVFYGLIMCSIVVTMLSPFVPRVYRAHMTREEVTLVNILVLVELATACLSIGMHNFSLGLVVAVVYTPLALLTTLVTDNTGSLSLFVRRVLCLALQPLCVISLAMMAYSRLLFPEDTPTGTVSRGSDAAMQAVMFSIVDSMLYGNWTFNVATSILLPIWIIFWQILCNPVTVTDTVTDTVTNTDTVTDTVRG